MTLKYAGNFHFIEWIKSIFPPFVLHSLQIVTKMSIFILLNCLNNSAVE